MTMHDNNNKLMYTLLYYINSVIVMLYIYIYIYIYSMKSHDLLGTYLYPPLIIKFTLLEFVSINYSRDVFTWLC